MQLAAALIYWVIIAIWLTDLGTIAVFYMRNQRAFGTTRMLLAVIAIDTLRNVIENVYFGLYFGSSYGLFSRAIVDKLQNPIFLILPKFANVAAGLLVLGLLLGRWLPTAMRERRASEQIATGLRELAAVDGMTGLFNRSHFLVLADAEWNRFQRYRRPLSLLIIDIDHFKAINDCHGHDVGDRAIVQIANTCRDFKRKSDIAARLGGEEFALLLPETKVEDARIFAERLREVIEKQSLDESDFNVEVTVSIGVSEGGASYSIVDLLKQADLALYRAKRDGRNRVCAFGAKNIPHELVEFAAASAAAAAQAEFKPRQKRAG
jgi:diguanylate cyclase (GGDEF)-like protein